MSTSAPLVWQPNHAYTRGDIVIDPYGVIRWCGVTHTSPSTFSAGTEYSGNGPWWAPVATNGSWRGAISSGHDASYGTQWAPNDLWVDPTTGNLERILYENGSASDLGPIPPYNFIDPGTVLPPACMPNSKINQWHGLWRKMSRLAYPPTKPIAVVRSRADFSAASNTTVVNDLDAPDPAGAAQFTGSLNTASVTKALSASVDLSQSIVRFPIKFTGSAASTATVGVIGVALSTSTAVTNLPLASAGTAAGLWSGQVPGNRLILNDGAGHTQVVVVSDYVSSGPGASVGHIPVQTFTPNFAYPPGTNIYAYGSVSNLSDARIEVSSDNFATTGASYPFAGYSAGGVRAFKWAWAGCGPHDWRTMSGLSAPNLAAINSVRWTLTADTGTSLTVWKLDAIPSNGAPGSLGDGRAKCVLWFDDSYASTWNTAYAQMLSFGFPGVSASSGAIDAANSYVLSVDQRRCMAEYLGWQFALHYYFPNDGGDSATKDGGPAKEYFIMRSRHAALGASGWGADDFAWHDDDGPGPHNLPTMRKYFRSVRGYNGGNPVNTVMTLPPVEPMYVNAYGISSSDQAGGTVATTAQPVSAGVTLTSIPINGLSSSLAAGESVRFAASAFTVSSFTAAGAGVTAIPVNPVTPAASVAAGAVVANPGSGLKALVDQAIAASGLIQFVWEQSVSTELSNLLHYLDQQRSAIDVVTIDEALRPWTVTS